MKPLKSSELRWSCPLSLLPFKSTRELEPLNHIVGQERAVDAILLGAQIHSQGYNIYASGITGTGRLTTIRHILDDLKRATPELWDFAYVHNFRNPDMPVLLRFHAGEGRVFTRMMEDAINVVKRRIPQLFEEEAFLAQRKTIMQSFQQQEQGLLKEFDSKIRPSGFVVGQVQEEDGEIRSEIFALVDEKPYQLEELDELVKKGSLPEANAQTIRLAYSSYRDELNDIGRRSLRLMAEFRKKLAENDQGAVGVLLRTIFDDIRQSFSRDRVSEFLTGVTTHVLEHLDEYVRLFQPRPTSSSEEAEDQLKHAFKLYSVNLILDNYDMKLAPVLVETSPTYATLFGTIERRVDARGVAQSDFSHIRAGSILRADGGYVVLNAVDILSDPQMWTSLKRVMLYSRLEIQTLDTQFQSSAVKPEWIKVNVKIILLGDPQIYLALWGADEDFHKMFKVHAEFADYTDRTPEMIRNYSSFFAKMAEEENLLHCDRTGAASLIEWAVEYTESQSKITLQFSYVADLMREASFVARNAGATLLTRTHVLQAVEQRHYRSNRADETIREQIKKGTLLIDVEGSRVGQINGLSVYSTGIVDFGKPSRITATVSAGNAGIINIEREVQLSGAIHSKGMLILTGLLRSIFSRAQPISFSASIAFEQSYGGVDGDSASAAEIVALLSAIANCPIRQDLAITGSINQKGDIQPVGGINEKILGFYEVCRDRQLTGTQGVVIPYQNARDLMQNAEIVEAVRRKQFCIYPIKRLEDAIFLMMGLEAGQLRKDNTFPPNTLFAKVQHNLDVLHEASKMHRGL